MIYKIYSKKIGLLISAIFIFLIPHLLYSQSGSIYKGTLEVQGNTLLNDKVNSKTKIWIKLDTIVYETYSLANIQIFYKGRNSKISYRIQYGKIKREKRSENYFNFPILADCIMQALYPDFRLENFVDYNRNEQSLQNDVVKLVSEGYIKFISDSMECEYQLDSYFANELINLIEIHTKTVSITSVQNFETKYFLKLEKENDKKYLKKWKSRKEPKKSKNHPAYLRSGNQNS